MYKRVIELLEKECGNALMRASIGGAGSLAESCENDFVSQCRSVIAVLKNCTNTGNVLLQFNFETDDASVPYWREYAVIVCDLDNLDNIILTLRDSVSSYYESQKEDTSYHEDVIEILDAAIGNETILDWNDFEGNVKIDAIRCIEI
jgi:hypothetical protein